MAAMPMVCATMLSEEDVDVWDDDVDDDKEEDEDEA